MKPAGSAVTASTLFGFIVSPQRKRRAICSEFRRDRGSYSGRVETLLAESPLAQSAAQSARSDIDRGRAPDFLAVLANRAIGRELTRPCHVDNRHSRPAGRVAIAAIDRILAGQVRGIVCKHEIIVAIEQGLDERAKKRRITARKDTGGDLVKGFTQFRV